MLKTQFENFEKGETFHAIGQDVLGEDWQSPRHPGSVSHTLGIWVIGSKIRPLLFTEHTLYIDYETLYFIRLLYTIFSIIIIMSAMIL